jgi:hypothetical protein
MEIIYSKTGHDFDHFFDSYIFLLEEKTFTTFEPTDAQVERLFSLYETLRTRDIEPVLFLSCVFNGNLVLSPRDLEKELTKFRTYGKAAYPIEVFKFMIEKTKESVKVWPGNRCKYYLMFPTDIRLVVFDPIIRGRLLTGDNPGFEWVQWSKMLSTLLVIENAKNTVQILKEDWIPFIYGIGR